MKFLALVRYGSFLTLLFLGVSCSLWQEDSLNTSPEIRLRFSVDTVKFDTVFSSLGSVSKRLKIYNPSAQPIEISRIYLADSAKQFSLVINGEAVNSAKNIKLLAKDSLLVLATVTINPQDKNLPFNVLDEIVFQTNTNLQRVVLFARGQDAVFYDQPFESIGTTTWNAQRPYVISDTLLVRKGATLTIEAGTRVHLSKRGAIFVAGTLKVEGAGDSSIVFQGLRLEAQYKEVPGQWRGIFFLEGSKNNIIKGAIIKNAQVGLRIGTPDADTIPDVIIENSRIANMSVTGIQAFTSDLLMTNSVVSNCAENGLALVAGGNYTLIHNTVALSQCVFVRQNPALVLSNFLELDDKSILHEPLKVEMINNIVWGTLKEELTLSNKAGKPFDMLLIYNALQTERTQLSIGNNLINKNPGFLSLCNTAFELTARSEVKGKGIAVEGINEDIRGQERPLPPSIGAFEVK